MGASPGSTQRTGKRGKKKISAREILQSLLTFYTSGKYSFSVPISQKGTGPLLGVFFKDKTEVFCSVMQ